MNTIKVILTVLLVSSVVLVNSLKHDKDTIHTKENIEKLVMECEAAKKWVENNFDNLPSSYEEFVLYPKMYQRFMYSNISNEVKTNIWTTHFEIYLKSDFLTNEQKVRLYEINKLLEPDFFDPNSDKYALEVVEIQELKEVFGEKGNLIFADLSPEKKVEATISTTSLVDYACKVGAIFSSCDTVTGPEMICEDISCTSSSLGCGFVFLNDCDGICVVQ